MATPEQHARLSASGASRWINCPPSVKLEEEIGRRKSSAFAEEGTHAHAVAEWHLRDLCNFKQESKYAKLQDNKYYCVELNDYAFEYAYYVYSHCKETLGNLAIEQCVHFDKWVPEGYGTSDANWVTESCIKIFDLKYGKGVPVYAKNNPQGMLYALGVINDNSLIYDFARNTIVEIHIYQPRIGNISVWETTVGYLLDWAEDVVARAAKLAIEGGGVQHAGSHCKFCAAKNRCKALAEYNLKLTQYDFAECETLTDEEIVDILRKLPTLTEWANGIKDYALVEATKGKKWPGYKLVQGRSNRVWTDETEVANKLELQGFTEDEIYTKKIIGIGAAEKLVGKKVVAEDFADVIEKPEGKPTLVDESDRRPEYSPTEALASEFEDESEE